MSNWQKINRGFYVNLDKFEGVCIGRLHLDYALYAFNVDDNDYDEDKRMLLESFASEKEAIQFLDDLMKQ